jgi:ribonuclease HI
LRRQLLASGARADCARPERLLDPDFVEIGASGRRWSRQEMIAELLESSEFGEVDI